MKTFSLKRILLNILLSLWLISVSTASAQHYVIKNYTVHDGLLSNEVLTISQDKYGDVWIVTKKGILKYNGNRYTAFNTKTIRSNDIFDVSPGPDDKYYLLDYRKVMHYIYHDNVYDIKGMQGKIKGLSYYKNLVFGHDYEHKRQYLIFPDTSIAIDEIPTCYYDPAIGDQRAEHTLFSYPYVFYVRHDSVTAINIITKQKLKRQFDLSGLRQAVGSNCYLFDFNQDSLKIFNPRLDTILKISFNTDANSVCYKIRQKLILDDEIQLTTQNGFIAYRNGLNAVDSLRLNTVSNNIISIFRDNNKNFWLVTHYGLLFINSYFRNMRSYSDLKYRKITNFNNKLYALDEKGNVVIHDTGLNEPKKITLNKPNLGPNNLTFFKTFNTDSLLILVTNENISTFKNGRMYNPPSSLQLSRLLVTIHDCQYYHDSLYINCFYGLFVMNMKTNAITQLSDYLAKNMVIGRNGDLFLSKDDGIYYMKKGSFDIASKRIALSNKPDFLYTDAGGNLIAGLDEDIYSYDLSGRTVWQLHLNDNLLYLKCSGQYLWAVTSNNIYRYKLSGNSYALQNQYYNFNFSLYEDVRDICELKDHFIVASNYGLVTIPYDSRLAPDNNFINGSHVEKIRYNNMATYVGSNDTQVTFSYKAKNVTFYFSINTISYGNNVTYNYFTEGLDNQWQKTLSPALTYPALPPGNYKLHLIASLDKYDIKSKEYILNISVTPLWWQRTPVKALFILIVLTVMAWGIIRLTSARKNKVLKRALIDKQMSELKLSALQSNMNPHFIFNALTSVQSFLKHNKNEVASVYITEFATLVRMYLEFSRKKMITLDEEIKALKLYASIEQKRFNNRFQTIFELIGIDDLTHITLPPLIIQPFIENAIVHGLYHKAGNGLLFVTFKAEGGYLWITVDDNGIGRAKSLVINSSLHKAPSRGLQLIQERVDILNNENEKAISIDIIDKPGDEGTIVKIRIPL